MMAKLERSPQQARMEAVSRDALVQAALQEITQNYREASLSNVARAYGVSLAYVSECVRAQTGRTYKELLQKHRMETAARLLRRSDLNIQQIIAQVGYENTSYFYRLFHERYGLSPREYRLAHRRRSPPPHRMKPSFVLLPPTVVLLPRARRSVFAAKWRKIWYFMEYCVILK